jgi:pyruvate/2-oxoglutarate dehydrogenase complex dihydrolipoamide acyltransferase (E2) component
MPRVLPASHSAIIRDEVAAGDSLADVETDKATMSFDCSEDGIIAKLLIEDGTSDIEIGQVAYSLDVWVFGC